MMNSTNQNSPVFAKMIVLGNTGSGRSSLIQNLQDCGQLPYQRNNEELYLASKQYSINHDNTFFSAIELSPQEFENSSQTAILKVWEYTEYLSKKDETMVFRGALFTVIVFDILDLESYQAVFEKWIPLKERMSPDSFLYVIGTHLDQGQYRRIQLHDICKACAKKDAVYVEVSNLDGFNIPLLRKLLCKRVQFMVTKREELASRNFASFLAHNTMGDNEEMDGINVVEEKRKGGIGINSSGKQEISMSYLEPNIMTNSVGSILSSYFGLESWEGLATHESEMAKIAERIDTFIEKLSTNSDHLTIDLNNISVGDELFRRESQDHPLKPLDLNTFDLTDYETTKKSMEELEESLKILGLNIPNHLLPSPSSNPPTKGSSATTATAEKGNSSAVSSTTRANLRRMVIKLPQGQSGEMILDLENHLEPQIDQFLHQHGMGTEGEAKKKLLQSTTKMQKEYLESIQRGRNRPGSANSKRE